MAESDSKLKIYYDGLCVVCSAEIDVYRKLDTRNKIVFIDISHPKFDAEKEQLDSHLVQKYLHVKTSAGKTVTGVNSFIEIWQTLGIFKIGVLVAKTKIGFMLMSAGYHIFVYIRPYLPRKKSCDSHHCDL